MTPMKKVTINILGLYQGCDVITPHGLGAIYETNYHLNMVSVEFVDMNRYYEAHEVKLVLNRYESLRNDDLSQLALVPAVDNNDYMESFERLKENVYQKNKMFLAFEVLLLSKQKIDIFGLIDLGLAIDYESDIFREMLSVQLVKLKTDSEQIH